MSRGRYNQRAEYVKADPTNPKGVKLIGRIIRETNEALHFRLHEPDGTEGREIWFPLSQVNSIHRQMDILSTKPDYIVVSAWLAKKEKLT